MKKRFKYIFLVLLTLTLVTTGCSKGNPNPDLGTQVTEMQDNAQTAPLPVSND